MAKPFSPTQSPLAYIERVNYNNPIVAIREIDNFFPNQFFPIIDGVSVPFKLKRVNSNSEDIGFIQLLAFKGLPNMISICPVQSDPLKPWNDDYTFVPLWSDNIQHIPPGGTGGNGLSLNNQVLKVKNHTTGHF
ncbi:MAG: hypothetical protein SFV55_02325 [Haliscomenobacter sp.]|uniref:hypothetical protein n=1 Tax=Haliscomenobacter sp. TaxID=2717303 RepID=UPI0029ABFB95|nr:hypothetical protein [Haliscomenobacter sp.]MDX2067229.1 hypothetical protein [Haliscomenobacter sp.]